MDPIPSPAFLCPRCETPYAGSPSACPKCRKWLGFDRPEWRRKEPVPWRFDLASVMIFIVVFALGLGLSLRYATAGIGIPLLLLGPASVVRATPILLDRRREGRARNFDANFEIYYNSCLVVGLLLLSGSIAFIAVCFPVGLVTFDPDDGPFYLWTSFGGGGLAACLVLFLVGRRIFPPKD